MVPTTNSRLHISSRITHSLRSRRFDVALAELQRADGSLPAPHVSQGLRLLRARLLLVTGSFDAAAHAFGNLGPEGRDRAKRARSLGKLWEKASQKFQKGQCDEVISALDRLLRTAREAPALYLWRGECQLELGQFRAAHSDASLAVSQDAHSPEALLLLARALYQSVGLETNLTIHVAHRCVRLAPDHRGCGRFLRFLRTVGTTLAAASASEEGGELDAAATSWAHACELHCETCQWQMEMWAAPPLPQLVRKRAYGGLCRSQRKLDNATGVLHWCQLLASLHRSGDADPTERAQAARAHVYSGWAHLQQRQTAGGLEKARYCIKFAESLLRGLEIAISPDTDAEAAEAAEVSGMGRVLPLLGERSTLARRSPPPPHTVFLSGIP